MPSAWGLAFGSSWGNAWGTIAAQAQATQPSNGGGASDLYRKKLVQANGDPEYVYRPQVIDDGDYSAFETKPDPQLETTEAENQFYGSGAVIYGIESPEGVLPSQDNERLYELLGRETEQSLVVQRFGLMSESEQSAAFARRAINAAARLEDEDLIILLMAS